MRRSVYERDVQSRFGKPQLREVTGEYVRAMADAIVARCAPATAVLAREITLFVFPYAIELSLSQQEIGQFYKYLEQVGICLSEPLWVSPPHERCYSEPGHDLQLGICPE